MIAQLLGALAGFAFIGVIYAIRYSAAWLRAFLAAAPSPAAAAERAQQLAELVVAEHLWLECHSTACAHLTTPHKPTAGRTATCSWCGTTRPRHEITDRPKEET